MKFRRLALALLLGWFPLLAPAREADAIFIGYITDTECGPNHAPMIAKGGMGNDDAECTLKCVSKGATFGFVDQDRKRFYQLDDQDSPRGLAGQKVRIEGRLEGDTIYVSKMSAADR